MISVFEHKVANIKKLTDYGFVKANDGIFVYARDIAGGELSVEIVVQGNNVNARVIDKFDKEEYTLHLVSDAQGAFVGGVRSEYEDILEEIARECFEFDARHGAVTQKAIEYIRAKYGSEPEYLWEKLDSTAVWRRGDNAKWFAIVMNVSGTKIGLKSPDVIDIMDLRAAPETIDALCDNVKYFHGWHMNKKHWISVPLNGALSPEELFSRIDISYDLAAGKAKTSRKKPKLKTE